MSATDGATAGDRRKPPTVRGSVLLAVLLGLLGMGAALLYGAVTGPKYQAGAELLVQDRDAYAILLGSGVTSGDPTRRMDTYALLAESESFLRKVAESLGRPGGDWVDLSKQFSATATSGANVLEFSVTTPSDTESVAVVLAASKLFPDFFAATLLPGLDAPATAGPLADQVKKLKELEAISPFVQVISAPDKALKVWPKPLQAGLAGLVAGLVVGLLVGAWRHRTRVLGRSEGAHAPVGAGAPPAR